MSETARLGLPLVQAAQAQKHVTVNGAFERIDALAQLVLQSRGVVTPPLAAGEGEVYAVPAGAVNGWAGHADRLAVWLNGGWDFLDPQAGWRAWIADEGVVALFDGVDWIGGAEAVSPGGAAFRHRIVETDHAVAPGAASTTAALIPAGSLVYGVTGRVLSDLGGTAASFRIRIGGLSDDRYGSGIGTQAGAWFRGLTSSPLAYYADTALTLTGEGGEVGGGAVRIAVHLAELTLPRA